jgi:hypothetical protein
LPDGRNGAASKLPAQVVKEIRHALLMKEYLEESRLPTLKRRLLTADLGQVEWFPQLSQGADCSLEN